MCNSIWNFCTKLLEKANECHRQIPRFSTVPTMGCYDFVIVSDRTHGDKSPGTLRFHSNSGQTASSCHSIILKHWSHIEPSTKRNRFDFKNKKSSDKIRCHIDKHEEWACRGRHNDASRTFHVECQRYTQNANIVWSRARSASRFCFIFFCLFSFRFATITIGSRTSLSTHSTLANSRRLLRRHRHRRRVVVWLVLEKFLSP